MAGFLSSSEIETLVQGAAVKALAIAGGVAGDHAVAGIAVGDQLRSVLSIDVSQADHAEIAHGVGAADVAHTTADLTGLGDHDDNPTYHAVHAKADVVAAIGNHAAMAHARTWAVADLTAEFTITGAGTINNAGGTNTTGRILLVVWEDWT